jgi:hypothetical protein
MPGWSLAKVANVERAVGHRVGLLGDGEARQRVRADRHPLARRCGVDAADVRVIDESAELLLQQVDLIERFVSELSGVVVVVGDEQQFERAVHRVVSEALNRPVRVDGGRSECGLFVGVSHRCRSARHTTVVGPAH